VGHWLAAQSKRVAKRGQAPRRRPPLSQWLQPGAGLGPSLAQTLLLATGAIGRFAPVGAAAASWRCVDSPQLSHGKRQGQGAVKNGTPYGSGAEAEAATFALRLPPQGQRHYQRKQANTPVPVARKTVAHQLARACARMRRAQVPFAVAKAFGEAMGAGGPRREAGGQEG
jgi:hypothetical protein